MHQNPEFYSGSVVRGEGPAYAQIAQQLRLDIANNHWRVGDNLPNEKRLAERFGVSIGTVRRAIKELEQAGLLIVMQGLGTFVNDPQTNTSAKTHVLFNPKAANPTTTTSQPLVQHCVSLSARPATETEAGPLNLQAMDRVWHIEMHLRLGTQLLAVQHVVVAQSLWPNLTLDILQKAQGNIAHLLKSGNPSSTQEATLQNTSFSCLAAQVRK